VSALEYDAGGTKGRWISAALSSDLKPHEPALRFLQRARDPAGIPPPRRFETDSEILYDCLIRWSRPPWPGMKVDASEPHRHLRPHAQAPRVAIPADPSAPRTINHRVRWVLRFYTCAVISTDGSQLLADRKSLKVFLLPAAWPGRRHHWQPAERESLCTRQFEIGRGRSRRTIARTS